MGRRGRRRGSQGRAEGRVRGRVRERVQGRARRGEVGGGRRRRSTLDVGAIGSYADRLADHIEDAPGLAGAASGLARSSLAHRITGSDSESSGEDFRSEIRARLDLMDERLQRLEDEMHTLREEGGSEGDLGDLTEPGVGPDPESSR